MTEAVTREQLYEQVWTTPLVRLAVQYGVSNVALGKTCRRLNIPVPGRGHWARIAAGEKLKRPPLPKAVGDQAGLRLERDPTAVATALRERAPLVALSQNLDSAHEIVRTVASLLRTAKLDEHERLVVGSAILVVTAATHKRALLILDSLLKALVARGHEPKLVREQRENPRSATLQVTVSGEPIGLSISECLERVPHEQTPEDKRRFEQGYRRGMRKYDDKPGGRLRVDIHDRRLATSNWADNAKRSLERALGHVIINVEAAASERATARIEEQERRAEEEWRRQREEEEKAKVHRAEKVAHYREWLVQDMHCQALEWRRAERLTEFLDAYERALPAELRTESTRRWVETGRHLAREVDPLSKIGALARDPDPDDAALERFMADWKRAGR